MFPLADIHKGAFELLQTVICQMVLVAGPEITGPGTGRMGNLLRKRWVPVPGGLRFRIVFPQAVDDYVHMNVPAFVMPVGMSAYEGLVTGKILFGKCHPELLCPGPGQPFFRGVLRIKTDDVVVGFDFAVTLVFTVFRVQLHAFPVESERIAV